MTRFPRSITAFGTVMAVLLLSSVAARAAGAQILPPNINKPIEAARKAAAGTSAQVRAAERVGEAPSSTNQPQPAATAQGGKSGPGQGAPVETRGRAMQSGGKGTVTFYREVFTYSAEGRRDPFLSLMATGEIRPLLADLALIGSLYNPAGGSVAVLVDASTGETYRVKVGQVLGRMKVVRIGAKDITLNIDEFGYSRQETLVMSPRKTGGQPGRR